MLCRFAEPVSTLLGIVKRPRLTEAEFEQVEAAFVVEDRSWKKVIRGRVVSAMGRFKVFGNKDRIKEAARSTKEKTQPLNLKRKGDDSRDPHNSPVRCKRSNTPQGTVTDSGKHSVPSSSIVKLRVIKWKKIAESDDVVRLSSPTLRLVPFLEEIKRSFSRTSPIMPVEGSLDIEQKFRMSFDKTSAVLYGQYEMLGDLKSIQGPLKEKLFHLSQQLADTESELEVTNRVSKRKDDTIAKLEKLKRDADIVIDSLKIEIEELEKLKDKEIIELRGRIEHQNEKIESLKRGDGMDFEALVDLPSFAPIRECIEDSTGDELVRRINEIHPEWDLTFLSAEVKSPDVGDQEDKGVAADPSANEDEQNAPDSTNKV